MCIVKYSLLNLHKRFFEVCRANLIYWESRRESQGDLISKLVSLENKIRREI